MTDRPEPIPDLYYLTDLPVGTKYRHIGETCAHTKEYDTSTRRVVQVIEWPQRTYDGIPADDLDYITGESWNQIDFLAACRRIRKAIAAQEDKS